MSNRCAHAAPTLPGRLCTRPPHRDTRHVYGHVEPRCVSCGGKRGYHKGRCEEVKGERR